jgi:hypothetical protein
MCTLKRVAKGDLNKMDCVDGGRFHLTLDKAIIVIIHTLPSYNFLYKFKTLLDRIWFYTQVFYLISFHIVFNHLVNLLKMTVAMDTCVA